ncbi:hypothetical protein BUALT_Bualt16G0047900 [Buddleja alternifolia]|uniref:Disease resistance RPP13-like protein 1 n=1 Tax=Buddleja alternifolia TaxID=168488 RepID=A0AAV6WJS6_9LAMI|nr:hypothetical protein BUALT_Bualt16G0047900 [Buddleja alternifolia]
MNVNVGEIFLGSFISILLDKLTSGDLPKFLGESIDGLLKKWSGKLSMLQAVLTDAETKQNSLTAVKLWLNDLQDLAYDLDDIVDALATEALRRKLIANAGTSNVWNLFSNHINSKVGAFVFDYRIAHRIEEITCRLEDLITQRSDLPLFENSRKRPFIDGERFPTTSLVNESRVYGRRREKEEVIQMLLDESNNVIPIVGMGGIGKTTLAQLVYNDDRVKSSFDLRAWVHVSDDFDISTVTKAIFEQVFSQRCDFKDLNMLQVKLKERLSKTKFLFVLDDVWIDNCEDWEILCLPFLSGVLGSKILVTTRNESVASIMSFGPSFYLKELEGDDSLSLLAQYSLGAGSFNGYSDLKEIGEKIVKKCNNLPLAVKTMAGILRSKLSSNEWEDVLYSDIWSIGDDRNKILPALKLSYHHLPPYLKRCFAYCSIFPKDYEFSKYELILLWMAEGFLNQSNGKSLEELGSRYFEELISRSFFHQSGANKSRFVMHSLINDLACYVAGRICMRFEKDLDDNEQYKVSADIRHLSFTQSRYETSQKFENLHEVSGLRTLLPLPVGPSEESFISNRVLIDLFPKLRSLRVLSLSCYVSINELPNSIGDLKHLRYLDLSKTWLKWLPESVTSLCNLQTLSLRDCTYLTRLPTSIHNLINLRHLDISRTYALQEMPSGIGLLTGLHTLSRFLVSKSNGLVLKSLGKLVNIEGALSIEELQNVTNAEAAKEANLMHKIGLGELHLEWSSDFDDTRDVHLELCVLDQLQPPHNLENLEIVSYGGLKFSRWIEDKSFPKLEKLRLSKCTNCISLPKLGHLPLLKELYIGGMNQVKTWRTEFWGNSSLELAFQSLETLEFEDMPEWQEWSSSTLNAKVSGPFPRLRKLSISSCPKLGSVPLTQLPSLIQLVLKDCGVSVLKSLPHMPSLTHLSLQSISGLTSLSGAFVHFPLSLQVLNINCCDDLVTLWPIYDVVQNLVRLEEIVVKECPQLVSLNEICLIPMLRSLHVERLEALKSLPVHRLPCSLRKLEIMWCKRLGEIMLGDCGASLEHLYIWNLDTTKLLGSIRSFATLTELFISGCDVIETFPQEGLAAPNLRKLSIWNCQNLVSLPHQMEILTCLEYLSLWYCPSLTLFPQQEFVFPPNLTYLEIRYVETLKPLSEWGLHRLISLRWFVIVGVYPDLVSFSNSDDEEKFLLPSTLTTFWVAELPNLKTLYKAFRNLFNLQHIDIWECPKLEALPMEDQLDKLWSLHIHECPLLEKRCLKDKGGYQRMIAEIPDVMIDYCRVPCSKFSSDERLVML